MHDPQVHAQVASQVATHESQVPAHDWQLKSQVWAQLTQVAPVPQPPLQL